MPKVTEVFYHTDIDSTCGTMYPIRTRTNNAMDVMYVHKGATDVFYEDFKRLLEQCTELKPFFDDYEKSFTIFNAKFYIRCINTVNAPRYSKAKVEYCVRPFLFKEGFEYRNPPVNVFDSTDPSSSSAGYDFSALNCAKASDSECNQMHYITTSRFLQGNVRNFNGIIFFYHSRFTTNMSGSKIPNSHDNTALYYYQASTNSDYYYCHDYPGTQYKRYGYDSSATIIPYDNLTSTSYSIEIYYNTNWIQMLYISPNNEKFSLGFFYVGKFTDPNTQEVEDILFTQQDGSNYLGYNTILGNNVYMSNYIQSGYAGSVVRLNNASTVYSAATKHTGSRSATSSAASSAYYDGPINNQWLMYFKNGHLTNVLEELGRKSFFYAYNANRVLNSDISNSVDDNDFQLYNLAPSTPRVSITQPDFGYLVPLDKRFFKTPLTMCNGMVKFENIIYGQLRSSSGLLLCQFFDSDMTYEIGDETYYCPFHTMRNFTQYNYYADILLKL